VVGCKLDFEDVGLVVKEVTVGFSTHFVLFPNKNALVNLQSAKQ
jgi:hypothetical protein